MHRYRLEIALAAVLLGAYAAFWLWQTSGVIERSLQPAEIDAYLAAIDRNVQEPPAEKAALLASLRGWSEHDDGRPVYLLNLMRYYDALQPAAGLEGFDGSPEQANALYEQTVIPLALAKGGVPVFTGAVQGRNLIGHEPGVDAWSRIALMRYPTRRHFLELLADPAYGPVAPYKLAALQVALVPISGQIAVPDLRTLLAFALLALFLVVAWLRALRGAPRYPDARSMRRAVSGVEPVQRR